MTDDRTRGDSEGPDLTPLDPRADGDRFERLVRELRCAATPELARRQAGLGLWGQLVRWRRPVFAASGLLALVAAAVLALVHPSVTRQSTLADAIGVPDPVARWLPATETPSLGDLLRFERGVN